MVQFWVQERFSWGHTPPGLLDLVSVVFRRRDYSPRTEDSYKYWIREYIHFHDKRRPPYP